MTLIARERRVTTEAGDERELVVACPRRLGPVGIGQCASCERCEGLELDGRVGVRCSVQPADAEDSGAPHAHARITTLMSAEAVAVQDDACVMTPAIHCVTEYATIAATAALMARERVHRVLVITDLGATRGIVSALDIVRWVAVRERFAPREAR